MPWRGNSLTHQLSMPQLSSSQRLLSGMVSSGDWDGQLRRLSVQLDAICGSPPHQCSHQPTLCKAWTTKSASRTASGQPSPEIGTPTNFDTFSGDIWTRNLSPAAAANTADCDSVPPPPPPPLITSCPISPHRRCSQQQPQLHLRHLSSISDDDLLTEFKFTSSSHPDVMEHAAPAASRDQGHRGNGTVSHHCTLSSPVFATTTLTTTTTLTSSKSSSASPNAPNPNRQPSWLDQGQELFEKSEEDDIYIATIVGVCRPTLQFMENRVTTCGSQCHRKSDTSSSILYVDVADSSHQLHICLRSRQQQRQPNHQLQPQTKDQQQLPQSQTSAASEVDLEEVEIATTANSSNPSDDREKHAAREDENLDTVCAHCQLCQQSAF